jgi:hypothetical protein
MHILKFSLTIIQKIIGKIKGKSFFYVIRDNDGGKEKDILTYYEKTISAYLSQKNFNQVPVLTKVSENHFTLKKGMHELNLIFILIPLSLEYQICQPYLKIDGLSLESGENYHDLLKKIAKHHNMTILSMITDSYSLLKKENWCLSIKNMFIDHVLQVI